MWCHSFLKRYTKGAGRRVAESKGGAHVFLNQHPTEQRWRGAAGHFSSGGGWCGQLTSSFRLPLHTRAERRSRRRQPAEAQRQSGRKRRSQGGKRLVAVSTMSHVMSRVMK